MNPQDPPEVFSLVRHFYGIMISTILLKEVMNNVANRALQENLPLVAEMIGNAFIDSEAEVKEIKR